MRHRLSQAEQERFGANLRRLRMRWHITQVDLADAVRIEVRALQSIEQGRQALSPTLWFALAEAMGVRATEFLDGLLPRRRSGTEGTVFTRCRD
jgi:transcriptional regulator with XRE-family HTH domain